MGLNSSDCGPFVERRKRPTFRVEADAASFWMLFACSGVG